MQYFKIPLKYIGCRLIFVLMTFCFMGPLFAISERLGMWFFSFCICIIYWPIIFDLAWKTGKFDSKPYTGFTPYPAKGFILGFISEIPAFLFLILNIIFNATALQKVFNTIYIAYSLPYLGFIGSSADAVTIWYLPVLFVVPLLSGIGYILGTKSVKVLDNLPNIMYKKEDNK